MFEAQPHDPDRHACPEVEVVQLTQAPLAAQAVGVMPAWQLVPSQQPPLQVTPPEQEALHFDDVHALPEGQSPAAAQPHCPPSWQTWPAL